MTEEMEELLHRVCDGIEANDIDYAEKMFDLLCEKAADEINKKNNCNPSSESITKDWKHFPHLSQN